MAGPNSIVQKLGGFHSLGIASGSKTLNPNSRQDPYVVLLLPTCQVRVVDFGVATLQLCPEVGKKWLHKGENSFHDEQMS